MLSSYFFFWFSYFLEEGVCEGLINGDPEVRIEYKDAAQQIDGVLTSTRVQLAEVSLCVLGESLQVLLGLCVSHKTFVVLSRGTNNLKNNC